MRVRALSVLALTGMMAVACSSTDDGNGDGGALGDGAAGGAGGGGGGAGGGGANACGISEPGEPNNDRDRATPYTAGTEVVACIGQQMDVDFYEVTAPMADMAGGYYQAAITDVGRGTVEARVYSAVDNSLILQFNYNADQGGSLYFYWAAAPGQKYRIEVKQFAGWSAAFAYKFRATYTKVDDTYEPNDTRNDAKPITVGAEVKGYFFTGFKRQEIKEEEYHDWYSVMLNAGQVTAKVDNVATDIRPEIKLYSPDGAELESVYNTTAGGSATLTEMMLPAAGMYRLRVTTWSVRPEAAKKDMDVPDSFKRPYTLKVTQ